SEQYLAAPARPARPVMLVEVSEAVAMFLDFKFDRKTAHGLTAQMNDGYRRRINNGIARLPNSEAQIGLFEMIEELLVKTSHSFKEFTTEHYAASTLPINGPFGIAFPSRISIGNEHVRKIGKGPQIKSCDPFTPVGRKRTAGNLVRAIWIEDSASKSTSLWMTISEFHPHIKCSIMDDRVRIQDENVLSRARLNAGIVPLGKAQVCVIFNYTDHGIILAYKLYGSVSRP